MDIGQRTTDRAEEMLEEMGLSFKAMYLLRGSRSNLGVFVVLAYKRDPAKANVEDMTEFYTFTIKNRARSLRNKTRHDNYTFARKCFDSMVDTGDFSHSLNEDYVPLTKMVKNAKIS